MSRSLFSYAGLALGALFFAPLFLFAQGQESTQSVSPSTSLSAEQSISIQNATLKRERDGEFGVSFTVRNTGMSEQVGLWYEVTLQSVTGPVASFVGSETLTLGAGEVSEKIEAYPLRDVPPGEYMIAVTIRSATGDLLGQSVDGRALVVTAVDNQAALYGSTHTNEVVYNTAEPASKAIPKQNIHLIISLMALALSLVVVVLAVTRQKRNPVG